MINRDIFTFIKEESGEWFIDLPEYIASGGLKNDLQMVAGADDLLDILAEGENKVTLKFTDKEFSGAEKIHRISLGDPDGFECGTGCWYVIKDFIKLNYSFPIWICDVTKYIFSGEFPWIIYFKVV